MRYIGNKTKLLDFIRRTLRRRGLDGGRAADPFAGTASVARALKRWGFAVHASDIMEYAYVFARAYVQTARTPVFPGLAGLARGEPPRLADVVDHLDALPGEPGFVHRHFTPAGDVGARFGRMYFTPENGARIDAVRSTLETWRAAGRIDDDGFYLLLAALLEAADRVANTTGVYASFVKSWQPNATRPLRLRVPPVLEGNHCRAHREDAAALLRRLGPLDLLYLDPPYNTRQYPGYYHVPELIARGWFDGPIRLRGKTGLMPDRDRRSDWARRARCEQALETLLEAADARHIVMSYNAEGIIPEATIRRLLVAWGRRGSYRRYHRTYRRYRSDADGDHRRYTTDDVVEYLHCVSR